MSRFAFSAQLLAGGIAAAFTVASAAAQTASPPDFSSNFTSWAAGIGVDFTPVEGSPSPLRQDPAHPFVPNGTGRQPTYRIADLSNPNRKLRAVIDEARRIAVNVARLPQRIGKAD